MIARMVELVDTLVSGTRAFTGVQVQVLFRAQRPLLSEAVFFYVLFKVLISCYIIRYIFSVIHALRRTALAGCQPAGLSRLQSGVCLCWLYNFTSIKQPIFFTNLFVVLY